MMSDADSIIGRLLVVAATLQEEGVLALAHPQHAQLLELTVPATHLALRLIKTSLLRRVDVPTLRVLLADAVDKCCHSIRKACRQAMRCGVGQSLSGPPGMLQAAIDVPLLLAATAAWPPGRVQWLTPGRRQRWGPSQATACSPLICWQKPLRMRTCPPPEKSSSTVSSTTMATAEAAAAVVTAVVAVVTGQVRPLLSQKRSSCRWTQWVSVQRLCWPLCSTTAWQALVLKGGSRR